MSPTAVNYVHAQAIHTPDAANEVLPYLFNIIRPQSVIDIGCGTGSWLSVAKRLGAERILGVDGIHVNKSDLYIADEDFLQHDLTRLLPVTAQFDLAICLEVAEHLPKDAADNLIHILCSHSNIVLFSAAIPGQGGQFHINEQWPGYWQAKFATSGFSAYDVLREPFWNNPKVNWWYKQNMFLYVKNGTPVKLNTQAASTLPVWVHPELFDDKQQKLNTSEKTVAYLEDIIAQRITRPKFFPSLKLLIKSILRR